MRMMPGVPATISRADLQRVLDSVRDAVPRSEPHLRVELAGRILRVEATDRDTFLTLEVAAGSPQAGKGAAVVNAKAFEKLVKGARATDSFELTVDGRGDLMVAAGSTTMRLTGTLDPRKWPKPPKLGRDAVSFDIDDEDCEAIDRVATFTSSDDSRPILRCVLLTNQQVVATDSYRLAAADVDLALPGDEPLMLDRQDVTYLPVDPDDPVVVSVDRHRLEWQVGPLTVRTRRIEGQFPPYHSLIPTASPPPAHQVTVDRKAFVAAVQAIERWATGNDTPVRLRSNLERDTLELVFTADAGEVVERAPATFSASWALREVGFNPTYLREGLGAMLDETVTFGGVDALKPWVMRETGFLYLLMPVRLAG